MGHGSHEDKGFSAPRLAAEERPIPRALPNPDEQRPQTLRGRIFAAIRTIIAVIPLTLLIWIYAEREQVVRQPGVLVRVSLRPSAADTVVRRTDPGDVIVELEGSRSKIERVRATLMQGGADGTVAIPVPADAPEGKTTPLPLLSRLEDAPIFRDNGINVLQCRPAYVDFVVDHIISGVEVRPQLPPKLAQQLGGKVTYDPPVVKLRGPRSVLGDASTVTVVADLREADIPRTAGTHTIASVPVRLAILDPNVTLTPTTVSASVTVQQTDATYEIASVPVFVSGPVTMLDRYRVVFPNGPFISRVTVVGPQEEIEKIRRDEFKPRATLEITSQDLRDRLPRTPTYSLPPGVSVSEEHRQRTIDFRLVDRTAPE